MTAEERKADEREKLKRIKDAMNGKPPPENPS